MNKPPGLAAVSDALAVEEDGEVPRVPAFHSA